MSVLRRRPAVAGIFYEADPEALKAQIEWCFTHRLGPGRLPEEKGVKGRESIGFVVPHAGYMYSGPVAAHAYYRLALEKKPDTVLIVGPNHTRLGSLVSVMVEGVWETPFGDVEIDSELAKLIVKYSKVADADEKGLLFEHSVEVQVPFLQYIYGSGLRIVPVAMLDQSLAAARDLAEAVDRASSELNRDVVFIATSDLTHYEPYEVAVDKDKQVIERILALDADGLMDTVERLDVTMCGPGPVAALIYFAKKRGARRGELLKYATSGDITGDRRAVVGYASIRVY